MLGVYTLEKCVMVQKLYEAAPKPVVCCKSINLREFKLVFLLLYLMFQII
jgi:hypothetical protein